MKRILISILILFFALIVTPKGIKNSKHNLSSQGRGSIKSSDARMVCVFCHTTHSPSGKQKGPLWNRETGGVIYTLYESSSLYSLVGQPDGSSKLCLSCHDGTISLGHVLNRSKEFSISNSDLGKIPRNRPSNLSSDISDDHPVSFNSDAAVSTSPDLKHPDPGDPVDYDKSGK
ncbi:MAG: hypothetical protein KAR14_13385, partial [Candidatus Aminicenantes bacterium]|nr:hypothetical protein [Candidatus Aminicenantes bacterium]